MWEEAGWLKQLLISPTTLTSSPVAFFAYLCLLFQFQAHFRAVTLQGSMSIVNKDSFLELSFVPRLSRGFHAQVIQGS